MMQFLDNSIPKANEWVRDFMAELQIKETSLARRLLSSTLHALRDRLPFPDAEKFGAQLPLVMREHFYGGWCPGMNCLRSRSREEFFRRMRRYGAGQAAVEEEHVLRAFYRVLAHRIAQHDIEDIAAILPEELQDLWEERNEK
jgi:uncharacterized protein (DUF2267 family)